MRAKIGRCAALLACLGILVPAGCSRGSDGTVLTLGYLPHLTHATALVGIQQGHFARELGGVRLELRAFDSGPQAMEALFSGAVDAAYLGPAPTINGYAKSRGQAIRVVAGAASGGAGLVVAPGIRSPADLRGRRVASPQLGNTQDVALRHWLRSHGLAATREGGGDVSILLQENAQILQQFAAGRLDGAWVAEPWITRLVRAGGHVLVDERTLWPDGRFVTTHLVVRTEFLDAHRDLVQRLVRGSVAANAAIAADPSAARASANAAIGDLTGRPLDAAVLAHAWESVTFTDDPLPGTLKVMAQQRREVGLLEEELPPIPGLYDLAPLAEALRDAGRPSGGAP